MSVGRCFGIGSVAEVKETPRVLQNNFFPLIKTTCVSAGYAPDQIIKQICRLSKERNREALTFYLLSMGVGIDMRYGTETAAQKLVAEGDVKSAKFLVKEFGASLEYALAEAARLGRFEPIRELIRHEADLSHVICGAARGGQVEIMEELLGIKPDFDAAVEGAAWGKQKELVENLLSQRASLNRAIYGAALGGHIYMVKRMLRSKAQLESVVEGAALGGHIGLVKNLILDKAKLKRAVYCAALGGHIDMMEYLLKRNAEINSAAEGAALGGHFFIMEGLLRRGAKIKYALSGAAEAGNFCNERQSQLLIASLRDFKLRKEFVKEGKIFVFPDSFNLQDALPVAAIYHMALERNMSISQAFAWRKPEIQGLFAYLQSNPCLSLNVFLLVASYLSSRLKSVEESKALYEKMLFEIKQIDTKINLPSKVKLATCLVS